MSRCWREICPTFGSNDLDQPRTEADILRTRIFVLKIRPTFSGPTSHSKMLGLEIFPHPTCEVKESGDCECLHPISHMASEKWEVGLKREFPFLKYLPQASLAR